MIAIVFLALAILNFVRAFSRAQTSLILALELTTVATLSFAEVATRRARMSLKRTYRAYHPIEMVASRDATRTFLLHGERQFIHEWLLVTDSGISERENDVPCGRSQCPPAGKT